MVAYRRIVRTMQQMMAHLQQNAEIKEDGKVFYRLVLYVTGDSAEVTEIDESDRLPRLLVVRRFDILCFVFSAVSYALDVVCDALTAYIHFQANRFWTFLFISLLTVLPSIALNIISFVWWLDDAVARRRDMRQQVITCSRALMLRCLACIFQLGPIVWYVDAVIAAVRFRSCNSDRARRYFYCRMVEADRDASLLRFFEAFLESGPQLLVQGVVLAHSFWLLHPSEGIPLWMYFQTISVVMSLLSICWSVSIQHRSLRIARPDKLNLTPFETFLQHVDSEPGYVPLEFGLLLICAAVHLFTPFNMAEGPTRWRYTVAYVMETAENTVVAYLLLNCDDFAYPYKRSIISVALSVFVCGIGVMLLYYWRWHPTKRVSENDSSGRIFIEQGFSETEDIQTTALSENLKYIDSD
ncbi:unnamed protein product [Toxocara canis]|uniref:XK-related protein n=1 Tax=Toxocara canis TaxID=6265 RepID=A0A183UM75_TOXCA|nr:unnamed protein product [Toxocara canis]